MNLLVDIDYAEGEPTSYRGVVVTAAGTAGREVARWASGDPQADWQCYVSWAKLRSEILLVRSSVTHFLWDVPGWRMIYNAEGHEIIVAEDRPRWLALDGASIDDEERLEYHPDIAVKVWNARLDGVSQTEICERTGLGSSRVRSIFNGAVPRDILRDLRYRTGQRASWISQGEADRLMDNNGKDAAFIVLLLPWRLTGKVYRNGLSAISEAIRADGHPAFSFGQVTERAPISSLLRMAHHRGYPAWEINPDGTAQAYDGRHEALVAPPATNAFAPEEPDADIGAMP